LCLGGASGEQRKQKCQHSHLINHFLKFNNKHSEATSP
jgi:hypothetical protein